MVLITAGRKPSQFISVSRAMDARGLGSGTWGELEQAVVPVKVDPTVRCQVFSPQRRRYHTWAFEKALRQNVFLCWARQHTLLQWGRELPVTSAPLVRGQGQYGQRPPAHAAVQHRVGIAVPLSRAKSSAPPSHMTLRTTLRSEPSSCHYISEPVGGGV